MLRTFSVYLIAILIFAAPIRSQTTAFTYQGKLTNAGAAASGAFDFKFALYPVPSGGSQIGNDVFRDDVVVSNGVFTVTLDFGSSPFTTAAATHLEIWVRPGTETGAYTQLLPRSPITSSPYAVQTLRAASAAIADDSAKLGGVNANQYVQTTDPRMTDARSPTAGSPDYIQNQTGTAQSAAFNISGNAVVGGRLGIGTANPGAGLELRGAGIQQRITDAASGNSLVMQGGAGSNMKVTGYNYGTGVAVPLYLSVDGANTILNSGGGNVGIGTASPNTRLTLSGGPSWTNVGWTASMNMQNASAFGWEANASGQRFGIGQSGGGLYFFRTNSAFGNTASPPNYDLTINDAGSVGLGTTNPLGGYRLDAAGPVRSFGDTTHFVAQTTGGTNSWARFYMRSTNRSWFIGTSQNFNGDQFYLVDETGGQSRMTIQPNGGAISFPFGHLGIGTGTPPTKLYVEGGNVGQSPSNFGLPKAMLLVRNNGTGAQPTIEKCYNAVSGSLTVPCGFSVGQPGGSGIINVSFPFRVTDRFISISPIYNSTLSSYAHVVGFDTGDISGGTMLVYAAGFSGAEADFYLIVY